MKKNLHNIDGLFKTALNNHSENPSEDVWDAIDKRLDKNKVIDINRKYIQLKRVAVALLVLLLGFGAYTLNHWTKINNQTNTDSTTFIKVNTGHNNTRSTLPAPLNSSNDTALTKKSGPVPTAMSPAKDAVDVAATNTPAQKSSVTIDGGLHAPGGKDVQSFTSLSGQQKNISNTVAVTEKESAVQSANGNTTSGSAFATINKGRKLLVNKRKLKTSVTNGGTEETATLFSNTNVTATRPEKKLVTASTMQANLSGNELSAVSPADMQPIGLRHLNSDHKKIAAGENFLPAGLSLSMRPARRTAVKNTRAFSATLFFAPNMTSNLLKDDDHHNPPPSGGGAPPIDHDDKDGIRKGEQRQSSHTIGLLLNYNLNKRWSIESGVELTSKTIHINPKTIYADMDNNGEVKYRFNCSSGYTYLSSKTVTNPVVGDSLQAFGATNTLKYIAIPVAVKYHYYLNRFDFFGTAGTALNILTRGEIATQIGTVSTKETSVSNKINGLKSTYFSGNLGVGLSYAVTRSIALSFIPSYNFAINSSTRDATVKTYPTNISLAAGIRYKL